MANAPKKFRLPSSGLGRTLLSLLITAAVGLVYFYVTLPALNLHDSQFYGGDGIIVKGVENTIRAVSGIARDGMRETDNEIIRLMIGEDAKK